ncbi:hypothetical protein ACTUVN_001983 [Pseudomonas caspiana]
MEEFYSQLHQLPNFLQSEVTAHAGHLHGLSSVQIVSRYRGAADHLIASKHASVQQEHIDNANLFWGGTQSTKADVENMMVLGTMPGHGATDFYSLTVKANFVMQCIRFLSNFRNSLMSIQPRLEEQERQQARRQAEEAARQLAQRLAEEAARQLAQQQAEEAERQRRAEEVAAQQRAKEVAMQLAQRQVEEATRALAQRRAEEQARQAAIEQSEPGSGVSLVSGPRRIAEIETAVFQLKHKVERAVEEFAQTVDVHFDPNDAEHLEAISYVNAN